MSKINYKKKLCEPKEGLDIAVIKGDPDKVPETWEEKGKVKTLFIYPLKSGKGVEVTEADATTEGLKTDHFRDRQFVATNSKNRFITGRNYPKLVLIETRLDEESDSSVIFSANKPNSEFRIQLPKKDQIVEEITIWDEKTTGVNLGQDAGIWLSEFLTGDPEAGLKLFWHSTTRSGRPARTAPGSMCPLIKRDRDNPLYGDGFPFLLVSEESIDNLNERLGLDNVELEVDVRRFRPNILIKGLSAAHGEDFPPFIKIGDSTIFRNVKLCTRCIFTTVDPDTSEKHPDNQPLKTLRQYRTTLNPEEKKFFGTMPFFGTNLGLEMEGSIQTGDIVYFPKKIPD